MLKKIKFSTSIAAICPEKAKSCFRKHLCLNFLRTLLRFLRTRVKSTIFFVFCVEHTTMKFFRICGCCLCCLLAGLFKAKAQTDGYRTKIAEFSYQVTGAYQAISNSETFGDASSEVNRDELWKIKLGIPLVINDRKLIGLQVKYYRQHFGFNNDDFAGNYDLYNHLNGQLFQNVGLRFVYQTDIDETRQFSFVTGVSVRGDRLVKSPNTSRYFVSGVYKKQLNAHTKIGFGAFFSYGMHLTSVAPVFTFEKTLNPHWTLDLNLPRSASIRRKINDKTFLIGEAAFEGWRYNLSDPIAGEDRDFTLRKADVQFRLKFEREIHDWLWFGAEAGYNKNVSYYLANPGDRGNNALIDLRARDARYFKLSIFIVPPKILSK